MAISPEPQTTKFTSGPWTVYPSGVYAAWSQLAPFTSTDGTEHADYRTGLIALVYSAEHDGDAYGSREANARLISLAPELYEALKAMVLDLDDHPEFAARMPAVLLLQARLVLAKVEGR